MAYSERIEERIRQQYETRCPRAVLLRDRLAGVAAFLRNEEHQTQAVTLLSAIEGMIDRGTDATADHAAQVEDVLSSWGVGKFPRRDQ